MDLGDLFLTLYDRLAAEDIDVLADARPAAVAAAAALTAEMITTGEWDDPGPGDPATTVTVAFAAAAALAHADPRRNVPDKQAMVSYWARWEAAGRLNTDTADGMLLFNHATGAHPDNSEHPDTVVDLFGGLLRVSVTDSDRVDFRLATEPEQIGTLATPPGSFDDPPAFNDLSVIQLPLLADTDDVTWTGLEHPAGSGTYHYHVAPVTSRIAPRVADALAALNAHPANLAILPEASLDNDVLAAWQQAFADLRPGKADIDWTLVGTGPVTSTGPASATDRKPNRAVVLNAWGEEVFTQDKRHGFTLSTDLIPSYGLTTQLGVEHNRGEFIAHGDRLRVVDTRAGRFAIGICEDAGHANDLAGLAAALGITHLLVPVIAPAMWSHGWQERAGVTYQRSGASTIVSNSLAISRSTDPAFGPEEPAPTLLIAAAPHGGTSTGYPSYNVQLIPTTTVALTEPADVDAMTPRKGKA